MLDRLTRLQLTIFSIVTVICVGAISAFYLHLPAAVGIGAYHITADFKAGGGLYQNANVTYRGVTIGRVEEVGLNDDGVVASMRLNTDTEVPDNVTATVKSVSAVGEQYIDLVPPKDPSKDLLRDGSNIGLDRTAVGQDIAALLTQADTLVNSIGDTRLQDLLRETFKAFNGSGPELARMIQSSRLLIDEANDNYGQISQLIDQAGPFLDAQIRSGDDIKSLADGLARFTTEAANADPQLRSVLENVPGADAGRQHDVRRHPPELPDAGRQPGQLRPHRRHLPQVDRAGAGDLPRADGGADHRRWRPARRRGRQARLQGRPRRPAALLDGIHPAAADPLARRHHAARPADRSLLQDGAERPVGRARRAQLPVQEFPGKRAPTVQLCRDPRGYVPIGSNPWRGPPVPYGHADHQRPQHHAAQQVPEHPAGRRLRPRPTRRATAARRPTGSRARAQRAVPAAHPAERPRRHRRRCRSTRRRTRSCRRTRGLRPTLRPRLHRRHRPNCPPARDRCCPSEATPPQASGPAVATYDSKTGVFVDPAGERASTPMEWTRSAPRRRGWT